MSPLQTNGRVDVGSCLSKLFFDHMLDCIFHWGWLCFRVPLISLVILHGMMGSHRPRDKFLNVC